MRRQLIPLSASSSVISKMISELMVEAWPRGMRVSNSTPSDFMKKVFLKLPVVQGPSRPQPAIHDKKLYVRVQDVPRPRGGEEGAAVNGT